MHCLIIIISKLLKFVIMLNTLSISKPFFIDIISYTLQYMEKNADLYTITIRYKQ